MSRFQDRSVKDCAGFGQKHTWKAKARDRLLKRGNTLRRELLRKCRASRELCDNAVAARQAVNATLACFGKSLVEDEVKKLSLASRDSSPVLKGGERKTEFSIPGITLNFNFMVPPSTNTNTKRGLETLASSAVPITNPFSPTTNPLAKASPSLPSSQPPTAHPSNIIANFQPQITREDMDELLRFLSDELLQDIYVEQEAEIYQIYEDELEAEQRFMMEQLNLSNCHDKFLFCPVCQKAYLSRMRPDRSESAPPLDRQLVRLKCQRCPTVLHLASQTTRPNPIEYTRKKVEGVLKLHASSGCIGRPQFQLVPPGVHAASNSVNPPPPPKQLACGCKTCKRVQFVDL